MFYFHVSTLFDGHFKPWFTVAVIKSAGGRILTNYTNNNINQKQTLWNVGNCIGIWNQGRKVRDFRDFVVLAARELSD